jgi:hypothetical protein
MCDRPEDRKSESDLLTKDKWGSEEGGGRRRKTKTWGKKIKSSFGALAAPWWVSSFKTLPLCGTTEYPWYLFTWNTIQDKLCKDLVVGTHFVIKASILN